MKLGVRKNKVIEDRLHEVMFLLLPVRGVLGWVGGHCVLESQFMLEKSENLFCIEKS